MEPNFVSKYTYSIPQILPLSTFFLRPQALTLTLPDSVSLMLPLSKTSTGKGVASTLTNQAFISNKFPTTRLPIATTYAYLYGHIPPLPYKSFQQQAIFSPTAVISPINTSPIPQSSPMKRPIPYFRHLTILRRVDIIEKLSNTILRRLL